MLKQYLLILAILAQSASLICNGDFEQYGLAANSIGLAWVYINSDYSCWYNKIGGVVEVKIFSPISTSMV